VAVGLVVAAVLCFGTPGLEQQTRVQRAEAEAGTADEQPDAEPEVALSDAALTEQTASDPDAVVAQLTVFVSGAVQQPGVYQLPADARINDAVLAAGGMRSDAALDAVNLAAVAVDGQQVHIPSVEEAAAGWRFDDASDSATAGSAQATASAQPGGASVKVNINTADAATLQSLNGIGPATAQKIIDYRKASGGFKSIEELKNVSGIGEKKFAAIADRICV